MTCWRDFFEHVFKCGDCKRVEGTADQYLLCPEGTKLHHGACQDD